MNLISLYYQFTDERAQLLDDGDGYPLSTSPAGGRGYLALGRQLLLVAVRRVSGDLAGPERQPHHQVGTTHHQQRQEVDQHGHTHVVSASREQPLADRRRAAGNR